MEPARADEPPIDVPLPPADGDVAASGNGGQVLIESLLFEVLAPGDLARAGEGWGGDAYVAWRDGDRSCIRWDMVADTADDLAQLPVTREQPKTRGTRRSGGAAGSPRTRRRRSPPKVDVDVSQASPELVESLRRHGIAVDADAAAG